VTVGQRSVTNEVSNKYHKWGC